MASPNKETVKNAHRKPMAWDKNPMMGGPKPPVKVQAIILKSQVFANDLQVSGTIDANEQVELKSEKYFFSFVIG